MHEEAVVLELQVVAGGVAASLHCLVGDTPVKTFSSPLPEARRPAGDECAAHSQQRQAAAAAEGELSQPPGHQAAAVSAALEAAAPPPLICGTASAGADEAADADADADATAEQQEQQQPGAAPDAQQTSELQQQPAEPAIQEGTGEAAAADMALQPTAGGCSSGASLDAVMGMLQQLLGANAAAAGAKEAAGAAAQEATLPPAEEVSAAPLALPAAKQAPLPSSSGGSSGGVLPGGVDKLLFLELEVGAAAATGSLRLCPLAPACVPSPADDPLTPTPAAAGGPAAAEPADRAARV